MSSKSTKKYSELKQELNALMEWFEGDDIDIDLAISKYKDAKKILDQLNDYLSQAEQKIKKV